jgi:hypothetical protein
MYVIMRMLLPRTGDSVMKLPLQQPCIEDFFGLACVVLDTCEDMNITRIKYEAATAKMNLATETVQK